MISRRDGFHWYHRRRATGLVKLIQSITVLSLVGMIACDRSPMPKKGAETKVTADSLPTTKDDDSSKAPASEPSKPRILFDAPQFTLTDQTGATFGSNELKDCVWIADFIFTRCTATCPRQTAQFEELQRRLQRLPDWGRIRLVSFTVDPENDTVTRLHEYAQDHHANHEHWKFLTGDRSDIWNLSKSGFKLPVDKAVSDLTGPITHSPRFILVDAQSKIRGYYDGTSDDDVRKLLLDVRSVLIESSSNSVGPVNVGVPAEVFDPVWMEERRAAQLATADDVKAFHDFQFADQIEASGIQFKNRAVADAASAFKRNHYDHATGLAVADVDGDGFHDVYFVSQVGGNELWRNLGHGRFENITDRAGVNLKGRVGVSASFADIDNDGDPDLYVTTTRYGNVLFENDGRGNFHDITAESGLEYTGHSSSADFFDYDRDGRLDLFLTNIGVFTTDKIGQSRGEGDETSPYYVGMDDSFIGHLFPKYSERSILYHNEGSNRFRDVSQEVGLVHAKWSGDATPLDANADGWMDIYVVNMQGNDEYYENIGGQKFERRSQETFPRSVWGGMCAKSFDYNNDGLMDLFITNMHADMWQPSENILGAREKLKPPSNVMPESYLQSRVRGASVLGNGFYENQGEGRFREISDEINAENFWPWGHSVGDLNADGYQDIFITSCMNYPFRYHPNTLLLNEGGRKFVDAEFILGVEPRRGGRTAAPWFELDCSGVDSNHRDCAGVGSRAIIWGALGSRSSVIFDLDHDGDLDIVTNDFNSSPMVLLSNLSERNDKLRYLEVQLKGIRSNRDGLGSKVQVTAGGRRLTQVHDGQSGYLSQSSLPLYFGLGEAEVVDKISVQWSNGGIQELEGPIQTNQRLIIVEE